MINEDYEKFVAKFQPKKTTDDCETPEEVYDVVIDWVSTNYNLKEKKIIRPFYPGGCYESFHYPDNCIVIDNPPFSIISKIVNFYVYKNISFFLFAPHLTLFSILKAKNYIVCGAPVIYQNGAKVSTSFVSNIFGDIEIIGCPSLLENLEKINKKDQKIKYKYCYPDSLVTSTNIGKIIKNGHSIKIKKDQLMRVTELDDMKRLKKSLYGDGYLVSDKLSKILKQKKEENKNANADNKIKINLSEREKNIIMRLNGSTLHP